MKNLLVFLFVPFMLVSCGENIPYEDKVVEELRVQMKNPDSFRLDSIKYIPKYLSDHLKLDLKWDSTSIVSDTEMKDFYEGMYKINSDYKKDYMKYQNRVDSLTTRQNQNLKLLNEVEGTDKDTLVLHTYRAYYMAQNSFGAMVKETAYLATTDGIKVYVDVEND
jgi:hypothetical protein